MDIAATNTGWWFLGKIKRFAQDPKGVLVRKLHPEVREQYRLSEYTGPSGYWGELREYQLSFLKSMGMRSNDRLIDIGCGPLQGGIAFISYLEPDRYVGVDICVPALAEGYKQIVKHELVAKNPRLLCSRSFGRDVLQCGAFDYAWSSQMLYHLDPDLIPDYFRSVSGHLKPEGTLYADILGSEAHIPEDKLWRGLRHYFHTKKFLEVEAGRYDLSMENVGRIHEYGYPVPCQLRHNHMLRFRKHA